MKCRAKMNKEWAIKKKWKKGKDGANNRAKEKY